MHVVCGKRNLWCALIGTTHPFYAEGTLDNVISGSDKGTTEDVQPKQAQPSVEQQVVNTEQPPEAVADIDLSDPELQKAASTIQARFRDHLKREEEKKSQEVEAQLEVVDQKETSDQAPNVPFSDLDLDDPELNKAASVIQSNFRTYLNEKNKTTEHAEMQKESEGIGDDTEPSTSRTDDQDLTTVQSSSDKTSPVTEESSADEQVPPPCGVQEDPVDKEESIANEPTSPENQADQAEEQAGDPKETPLPHPEADEEPQPVESEGEGTAGKQTEPPQAEGSGGEKEGLPETSEENKEEKVTSRGDDGNGRDGGDAEPADGKDTCTAGENVEQTEAIAGDGENQEKETPEVSCTCIMYM